MLNKLIDVIINFWRDVMPVFIINEYQRGVFLHCGKFVKTLEPGLHFKIPFIQDYIADHVVPTTLTLPCQSITTKDGKNIVAKGIIKYKIDNIKVFLLEVNDAIDAISDMTQSIIKKQIMKREWDDCVNANLDGIIPVATKTEAQKWGIYVIQVTLSDLGIIRSFRLFNEQGMELVE